MQYIDCYINPITRQVTYPAGTTIVQKDTNVEILRFHFSLEAEHKLEDDSIRVMVLKGGETRAFNAENVRVETNDGGDEELVFEHTITTYETAEPGQIAVSICGNQISGDVVDEAWHTLNMTFQVSGAAHTDSNDGDDTPETAASNAEKIAVLQTLVDGITSGSPIPVDVSSKMTDHDAIYLYTGSENGYYHNYWYYYNGTQFIPGAEYGTVTSDAEEFIQTWLDEHPEATTTVQDGAITKSKLSTPLKSAVKDSVLNMTAIDMRNNTTNNLGDCTVFHGDVNGIVDFGADSTVPDLLNFLTANLITHIDFVIISHYHGDHVTGNFGTALTTLINGGIDFSDCTFYLPHKDIDWSQFTGSDNQSARETLVKNTLTSNGFNYVEPTNRQTVQLSPYTSLTFLNIGNYSEYYSCFVNGRGVPTNFTVYNNFSMITVLDHCGAVFLLSGDIHELAQSKNYQYIEKCDVYKVEHHGVNSIVDSDWQARIVPGFVVVEQYAKDSYNTLEKLMPPLRRYCDRGAKLLFTGSGTTTIQSKGGDLSQKSGGCFNLSMASSLAGGEPITVNSDLDNYVEIGQYYCQMNNTVATLSNCPTTSAFRMSVENPRGLDSGETLYRLQRLTAIVSGTEYRRYATITNGVATFSDWTPEIITLTLHVDGANYFTDSGNTKVIKNGSMCIVRIEGTITAETSGWISIFSGAPKAAKGQTLPANLITNSGTLVRARVTSYGILQIYVPTWSENANIGTTFVYISN